MLQTLQIAAILSVVHANQVFAQLESRQTSSIPPGWSALGCYTDSTSSRTLNGKSYSSTMAMTPTSCINFCGSAGFKYAGVEYAQECYCDNTIRSPGAPTSLSDCNKHCTGDASSFCGAGNRLNVYESNITIITPTIKQTVGTWQYKGCYIDFGSRILTYRIDIAGGSSAEKCTATCKANGYGLAGLEYGSECWCDNYLPYGQLVDDSQCNFVCPADNTELCGAGSRLALYQDNSATPVSPDTCIPGRDAFTFGNTGIQAIPKQGSGAPVQLYATTLNPNTQNLIQYTILTNCKTCGYSSAEAPLYNFQLYNSILMPYGLFGNPIAIAPTVGQPQFFIGFSSVTAYAAYCAKPNPISPTGPFIGYPVLSVGGHTDLWGLCSNVTAGGRLEAIYSPIDNHPNYVKANCQDVYLQLNPYYANQ